MSEKAYPKNKAKFGAIRVNSPFLFDKKLHKMCSFGVVPFLGAKLKLRDSLVEKYPPGAAQPHVDQDSTFENCCVNKQILRYK